MRSVAPTTPYGYTIFCDDIRQEMGGKVSHMGIYGGKLIVNSPLPVTLPKLALAVHYFERPSESTESVTLQIYMPGEADPITKVELPVIEARAQAPPQDTPESDPLIGVIGLIMVTPFEPKSEGLIRVRAYRGDLEIRLGTLSVVSRPAEDSTPKETPPTTKKSQPKRAAARKRARSKKST